MRRSSPGSDSPRRLRSSSGASAGGSRRPPAADPAEELKQKLAETRTRRGAAGAGARGAREAPLDERRREVHDRARAAIDDMLGGEQLPGEESE